MARRDYLDDPNAPHANSIAVAASAFVVDDNGRILMIRRTDNNMYSLPGGQLELGETLTETARREVREETGIDIEITGLVGIYSNPNHVVEYDDGEVRQEFSICFRARPLGGIPRGSSESSEALWIDAGRIKSLDIHPSTKLRIDQGFRQSETPYYT